jgi:hypothetical protein
VLSRFNELREELTILFKSEGSELADCIVMIPGAIKLLSKLTSPKP